jgi:hypothetical protein
MRKYLLAAALALGAVSGCSKSDAGKGAAADVKIPDVTVADLDQWLTAKSAQAVDCNSANTRKRAGIIPGAILVTDEESYPASELPGDKQAKLVFYCGGPG